MADCSSGHVDQHVHLAKSVVRLVYVSSGSAVVVGNSGNVLTSVLTLRQAGTQVAQPSASIPPSDVTTD